MQILSQFDPNYRTTEDPELMISSKLSRTQAGGFALEDAHLEMCCKINANEANYYQRIENHWQTWKPVEMQSCHSTET